MELNIDVADDFVIGMMRYLEGDQRKVLEVALGLLAWVCKEDSAGRVILSAATDGTDVMRVNDYYMKTQTPSNWKSG